MRLGNKLRDKWEILIFMILASFVIKWFSGWYYIHQIDSIFFLNPERRAHDVAYFWRDGDTFGMGAAGFNGVPFYEFQYFILKFLSVFIDYWKALVLSQITIYYLNVLLAFIGSYAFYKLFSRLILNVNIRQNEIKNKIILIIASVAYVINPHTISMVFGRYMTWGPFWTALPILSYLYLKYIETRKIKYIIFSALVFVTPLGIGFSQAGFVNLFLVYAILTIVYKLRYKDSNFIVPIKFMVLLGLMLAWVIVPQIIAFNMTATFVKPRNGVTEEQLLIYASKFTTILNIYRFIGYYALHSVYLDSYPFAWAESYLHSRFFMTALFVYPLLFVLSLLLVIKEKNAHIKSTYLFLASIYIILPLIMKGTAEPFSNLGILLLKINRVFFRHPYDRFIHTFVFVYTLLLLYLLFELSARLSPKKFYSLATALITIFAVLNYPFFNGQIVHPSDKIDLSGTGYLTLEKDVKGLLSPEYRVLIMPFSPVGTYSYNISGTVNHISIKSLLYSFLPNMNVVQFATSSSDKIFLNHLSRYIEAKDYQDFVKYIRLMNIKYIALHKDFSLKYEIDPYYKKLAPLAIEFTRELAKKGYIRKIFENDNIILYEVKGNSSPPINVLSQIVLSDDGYLFRITPGKSSEGGIYIPETGTYILTLKGKGTFMLKLSNYTVNFDQPELTEKEYILKLNKGYYKITAKSNISVVKIYCYNNTTTWNISEALAKGFTITPIHKNHCGILEVQTNKSVPGWSWILGEPINVKAWEKLMIVTHIKYKNVKQSHISILGYSNITKKWDKRTQLVQVPSGLDGTSNVWEEHRAIIKIPQNITKIRPALNAGWKLNQSYEYAITWFGNITVFKIGGGYITDVWLYSTNKNNETLNDLFKTNETPATVQNYRKINPTLWKVKVNATKPFFLTFAESYDPLWEARVYKDGKLVEKVHPVPVYGVINGFWINQTGNLEIVLRYTPQDWFERGLIISLTTFILSIFYLFYDWRREKGDRWAKRLEKKIKDMVTSLKSRIGGVLRR